MEGEETKLFCNQCGKQLELNAQYCMHCGAVVAGTPADEQRKTEFKKLEDAANEGRMNLVTFLVMIYAIPALIFGIYMVFNIDAVTNATWHANEKALQDLNITQSMLHDSVQWISYMVLASGICATISAILCFLRRYWIVAVILCFAAAILCVWSLFGAIIGIFVGWLLISAKISFETPRY